MDSNTIDLGLARREAVRRCTGGSEGTALIAAQQQLMAGQYLIDPMNGQMFQSGQTAGQFAGAVASQIYGTAEGRFAARGIDQGRLSEFLAAGALRGGQPTHGNPRL